MLSEFSENKNMIRIKLDIYMVNIYMHGVLIITSYKFFYCKEFE
jgi:hypothetical protein